MKNTIYIPKTKITTITKNGKKLSLVKGKIYSEKQILEVLSKESFKKQLELNNIDKKEFEASVVDAKADNSPKKSIEELLAVEDKFTLTVAELKEIIEAYKLNITGNKPELIQGVKEFEEILDVDDLDSLNDEELKAIANYCNVDVTLEREELIEAIDNELV